MRIRARLVLFGLIAAFGLNPLLSTSSDAASDGFRSYAGETKERITEAAKTVLAASDPKGFEFTDSLNGFTGYRSYSEYAVIVYTTAKDKWVFETETEGKSVNAAVSVFSIGTRSGTFNSTAFEEPATSRPLMQIFWARVDYVLGREPNWPACPQSGSGNDLDPLCRSESGRSVPVPTPLPAVAAAPRRQR